MDTQLIEVAVAAIRPNPRQPRQVFDETSLQELADSIREHGLIQPVTVMADGEEYTLLAGERRWRAAALAGLAAIPAVVRARVDERAWLELALIENVQREDLTVAEEARAYQQLHDEFGLSDEEIGHQVGKSRSTVANLRGLARLPEPVLRQVGGAPGQISQNLARSLAVAARYVKPEAIAEAADKIVEIDERMKKVEENGDSYLTGPDPESVIADLVKKVSVGLPRAQACWDLAWPGTPIAAEDGEGRFEIRACEGCEHFIKMVRRCTWERCFTAKQEQWRAHELQRVSAKTGIPLAASDEALMVIEMDWRNTERCRRWVKQPPKHLRLVLRKEDESRHDDSYHAREILGSPVVRLATTSPGALEPKEKVKAKKIAPEDESPAAKAKRQALEEAEQAARREEKAAARRAMHDVDWLGVHTAQAVADQVQASGSTLAWVLERVANSAQSKLWLAMDTAWKANRKSREKAKGKELESLQREAIVLLLIWETVARQYQIPPNEWHFDWPGALKDVEQLVEKIGLKLPKGWDEPPIHRTDHNCHVCGKFTPNDHITKRDIEEDGWDLRYLDESNKKNPLVTCSDACRAKLPKVFPAKNTRKRRTVPKRSER